ncbi:MAG: hypothetical protein V4474_03940 [Patescibacteria group bacterium]
MSDKVISIKELQSRRGERELKKLLKGHKPIKPAIDLRRVGKLHFSPSVIGRKPNRKTELHLIVHDVTAGYANPIGVLRLTATQWKSLKKVGDNILKAHFVMMRKHQGRSK